MFILTVSEKGGQQSTFEFDKTKVSIGRMKGNDIVLPKGNVSKRHSKIVLQANVFSISDAGSTNGTFVNGRRIQGEQIITNSDKIYIGDFILQLETAKSIPPTPPSAPTASQPNVGSGFNPNPTPANQDWPESGLKNTIPAKDADPIYIQNAMNTDSSTGEPSLAPPVAPSVPPVAPLAPPPFKPAPPTPIEPSAPAVGVPDQSELEGIGNVSSVALNFDAGLENLKPESPRNIPIFVDPLEDNFDEDFQKLHIDLVAKLFKDIKLAELPKKYPPKKSDVTKYTTAVTNILNDANVGKDEEALKQVLLAECIGLGPIEALLDDSEVIEIFVHRYDQVFVRKSGNLIRYAFCFGAPEFLELAATRLLGKLKGPIQQVTFDDGTQVSVSLPPLTDGPVIAVSKPREIKCSFDDLVANKTVSSSAATFLQNAVAAGKSILVTGPQKSGRTTLIAALAAELRSGFRTIAIEDASNLALPEFTIRFKNDPTTTFNPVEAALQMHPDRIILDPCNTKNSYAWVNAISSGTAGSIASVFGTTTSDALGRLESMVLLGENRLSPRGVREQISRAVDVVIVLNRTENGSKIQQISEVSGVDFDSFRTHDVFSYRSSGKSGGLHPTGYVPSFYEDLKHSGFDVDFNIFRE